MVRGGEARRHCTGVTDAHIAPKSRNQSAVKFLGEREANMKAQKQRPVSPRFRQKVWNWLYVLLAVAAVLPPGGAARAWEPTKPITIVVVGGPGSTGDVLSRKIVGIWEAHRLVAQRVQVTNVTGGGGLEALRLMAVANRGNPHMLMLATATMVGRPLVRKWELSLRNLTPIVIMVVEPTALITKGDAPYVTLKDLIETARRRPRQISQGGPPFGGFGSLIGRLLSAQATVEFNYVPFRGGGPAVVALLGGHVDFILEQPTEVLEHVKAGSLKFLATSASLAQYPDVPTFASLGYRIDLSAFRSFAAPPGIPEDAAAYYRRAVKAMMATAEWKEYAQRGALAERWLEGPAMASAVEAETKLYQQLVKEMGLLK